MSDSNQQINATVGRSVSVSGQITVAALVPIFAVFIIVLILYLRAKGYSGTGSFRSRPLIYAAYESTLPRDPSILSSLPITIFQFKDFEEDRYLECAFCLSELEDGEEVRLLPKCNHGFQVDCIDSQDSNSAPRGSFRSREFNDYLNEGCSSYAGSSSSRKRKEGMLVIDILSQVVGAFSPSNTPLPLSKVPSNSPLPTSRVLEEIKSLGFGNMKSLERMLSRGVFKGVGSYSPIGCAEKAEVSDSLSANVIG